MRARWDAEKHFNLFFKISNFIYSKLLIRKIVFFYSFKYLKLNIVFSKANFIVLSAATFNTVPLLKKAQSRFSLSSSSSIYVLQEICMLVKWFWRITWKPDPLHRPTLDQVLKHDFFISGHMPASLHASCCSKAPNFTSNDSGGK